MPELSCDDAQVGRAKTELETEPGNVPIRAHSRAASPDGSAVRGTVSFAVWLRRAISFDCRGTGPQQLPDVAIRHAKNQPERASVRFGMSIDYRTER